MIASIRGLGILVANTMTLPTLSALPPPGPEAFLALAVNQTLVGHCRARLSPDTVVLRGSLSAETLKAEQAAQQIERQLSAVRTAVSETGGTLVPLARSREIDPEAAASLLQQGEGKPFRSIQAIEILLPDEAGLDRLIDRLLVLGMGAPTPAAGSGRRSGPQSLVSYRISQFDAQLEGLQQDCRADAVTRWCRQRVSETNGDACEQALTGFAHYLRDNGVSLHTGLAVQQVIGDRLTRLGALGSEPLAETLDLPTPTRSRSAARSRCT